MTTVPKPSAARSAGTRRRTRAPGTAELADLPDDELLEQVQRQTFRFFWEGGHPVSGLAPDRRSRAAGPVDDLVAIGGTGFGLMCIIVAVERGWVTRAAAVTRIDAMLDVLTRAPCYHGAFPHFLNGRTGATIPFFRKDDAADLVETSFLCMGLLCVRQYFRRRSARPRRSCAVVPMACGEDVEWTWFTQDQRRLLYWHWSPNNGWAMDHEIRGWNECLITYVLAAAAPRYAVDPLVYHRGFAAGRDFHQRQVLLRYPAAPGHALSAVRCSSPTTPSAASIPMASRTAMRTTGSRTSPMCASITRIAPGIRTAIRATALNAGD